MENGLISILLIDADKKEAEKIRRLLDETPESHYSVKLADRLAEGLEQMSGKKTDLVLIDLDVPEGGLESLRRLHQRAPKIPIIALAAANNGVNVLDAIKHEAQDCLLKNRLDRELLLRSIHYALERKRIENELRKAHLETDLILSSITSILIGLNERNEITHWNAAAETTFGLMANEVMHKSIASCQIPWEAEAVFAQIEVCRKKNCSVRLNDVRFVRSGIQEGFLGLSIIPMKSDTREGLGILIFGADITERKQLEQLKDEFVSTVSHELRTPLTVIREGVSQVLDGILGDITEGQRRFLSISLQAIDRLARIINDLLDISKIEANKLELKLDLINFSSLVHDITALTSPFQLRAKDKGLELKSELPEGTVRVYADKDKLIQILSNLVGNALKFTEKGHIHIRVKDEEDRIECLVSDTGRGISPEDLPKVFTKFQQFGRKPGPGEKGTGLGLAISKGLIEMHGGSMWVKSEFNQGSIFCFMLPKLKSKEIFKRQIATGLSKAIEKQNSLSLIGFEVVNIEALKNQMSAEAIDRSIEEFQQLAQRSLRHKADRALRSTKSVLVVLPSIDQQDALNVAERIERDYETLKSKNSALKQLNWKRNIASYPNDGNREDLLLSKVLSNLAGE